MVKVQDLIETTDELMEQIVLADNPDADIYKDINGDLHIKKRYGELRKRIFTIMNNNLNNGKHYELGD